MAAPRPVPRCPIRPGDACTLCFVGATGPEDCGLVWQVMQDDDLRARLVELRAEIRDGARGETSSRHTGATARASQVTGAANPR
jgi:hypothetical protein